MGHLNELQDKYGTMGFTVLAVTDEEREKVDAFVEQYHASHPIVIESSDSNQAFGSSGFPSSFLIAPDGKIAWAGHPAAVPEDMLEDLLTKAELFPDCPKSLASVRRSMEKGRLNDAVKTLAKKVEGGKLDEEESAWAKKLEGWLEWNRTSVEQRAAKALERGDVYNAWLAYETTARRWKGAEFADEAKQKAKELLADKAKKAEIDAGKKLAKITRKLVDASPNKAIKALKPMTSKRYADTAAGKQAAKLIEGYEKELQRLKGG